MIKIDHTTHFIYDTRNDLDVKDFVKIGDDCLIGMSSKVMSNIKSGSIVIERASEVIDSKNKIAKMLKKKL